MRHSGASQHSNFRKPKTGKRKSALRLGTIARERSVQTAYPDSGTEEVQHPPASAAPGKEEEDMEMVVVQNS
ncbi:hypothetical protein HGM15179_002153 [Zosterops borbonicus]|uniref:Uncharacterized protein n=1 Tax=Zosterops borbonicus TaxID=364589 RepID=A0A8K1LSY4_9PASS|nr:hypothetical protein HGM15179_002153 [Zosterops borbonicus]